MFTNPKLLDVFFDLSLNRWYKSEMSLLFGEGYYVKVNFIKYSTNRRQYVIDCKLMVNEPELCVDTYPLGLEMMINKIWNILLMGDGGIILSSTIELIGD